MPDVPTEPPGPSASRFEVFPIEQPGARTRYAWRLITRGGQTCLVSGTGFTTKTGARSDALRIQAACSGAAIEDVAA